MSAASEADVVDFLNSAGQWRAGRAECSECGHVQISVAPVRRWRRLECSECGALAAEFVGKIEDLES